MAQSAYDLLTPFCVGAGRIEPIAGGARLVLAGARRGTYSDSQLDDFHGRARADYRWKSPATLSLQARFSHSATQLRGTAGFGWWNNPFAGEQAIIPLTAPRSAWFFFASSPATLALSGTWKGQGWFAQSLNVRSLPALGAAFGLLLLRLPKVSSMARDAVARLTRAAEQPLATLDITEWHTYRIEWRREVCHFLVDDLIVMSTPHPPQVPLAMVIWMDNQYASVQGRAGTLDTNAEQWMEIRSLNLWHESLP